MTQVVSRGPGVGVGVGGPGHNQSTEWMLGKNGHCWSVSVVSMPAGE